MTAEANSGTYTIPLLVSLRDYSHAEAFAEFSVIIRPAPNTFVPPELKPEPEPEDDVVEEEVAVPGVEPVPDSRPVRIFSEADRLANEIRAQVNAI